VFSLSVYQYQVYPGEVDTREIDTGKVDTGEVDMGEVDTGEVDTGELMHDNDILRMRYWNGVKLDQVSLRRLSVLSTLSGVCH
jgi:hypothetical protein